MAETIPKSMSLTENCSLTFSTTESECLNFFFDVFSNTPHEVIVEKLALAWNEDALLTLKLVFQLRDIRKGKGAKKEFHLCLLWLYQNHPKTMIENLKHVPLHGYWKDLSWAIKFILDGNVAFNTTRLAKLKNPSSVEEDFLEADIEDLVRRRLSGISGKSSWHKFLNSLPDAEAKQRAALKYASLSKAINLEKSQRSKAHKKLAHAEAISKLETLKKDNPQFASIYQTVVHLFASTLAEDLEVLRKTDHLPTTALCGKWSPTVKCSIDHQTDLAKSIAIVLYPESKHRIEHESDKMFRDRILVAYRKEYLIPLRKAISVAESFMSRNKWNEIPYDRVPSVCMKRSKKLFAAKDSARFLKYLEDVKSGKKKIASGALLPHEIIAELMKGGSSDTSDDVCELQWKSYVDNLGKLGVFDSTLAVCDVSGSMMGTPMEVAIALSILTAELSKPPFNEVICTFSAEPQLFRVNQKTLKEKVNAVREMDWGMNTDFQAVFDLILGLAVGCNLPSDKMVKTVFVFSDMEFDSCGGLAYETDYQLIKRKYEEAGYSVPQMVFWNLRGGNRSKPVTKDQLGVALMSGFSGQMMKSLLETGTFESPYQVMLDSLGKNYDHLVLVD